jgi:hypothetical protein
MRERGKEEREKLEKKRALELRRSSSLIGRSLKSYRSWWRWLSMRDP